MLKIKKVTLRNFLSTGNVIQTVDLENNGVTLVLGENIDLGGGGARNGVGKTALVNAIVYALFGQPLLNIRKDNLINNINQKSLEVSLEFEKNGHSYRIERGRRPNYIRYIVNDHLVNAPDTDEAEGDSKWTQHEIEKVLGVSSTIFKQTVALNTYTEPFLSLKAGDQRIIIEQLLGITMLSEKAENLKEMLTITRDNIKAEELSIQTKIESNTNIQRAIDDLKRKSLLWTDKHGKELLKIRTAISDLESLDIDKELANHQLLKMWNEIDSSLTRLERDRSRLERTITSLDLRLSRYHLDIEKTKEHNCPTCGQEIHDSKHDEILKELELKSNKVTEDMLKDAEEMSGTMFELEQLKKQKAEIGSKPITYYGTIEEAYEHRATVERLTIELAKEEIAKNPYVEQIETLETTGLQTVTYENLNTQLRFREHQEFLLKLLTNKESFIRKKIIDQNLTYLNARLSHYLDRLGLPHLVRFLNDLTVEITQLGRELDFDNLSRGERTRLILGLSWAFRDIFESLNAPINLLFIDELLDSGLDVAGLEASLEIIKKMGRERNKNIFLISHRDELTSRVNNLLYVKKEHGFTSFESEADAA